MLIMLDALGISSRDINGCIEFLKGRDKLVKEIEESHKEIKEYFRKEGLGIGDYKEPEAVVFQDTIVLAWEQDWDDEDLVRWGVLAWSVVPDALKCEFIPRGAMAEGEYILEKNTILGPALFDAARWYEKADWIGIIATPSFGKEITDSFERILHNESENIRNLFSAVFSEYQVPLKDSEMKLWAINHPILYYLRAKKNSQKARSLIKRNLSENSVESKDPEKYEITMKYFEYSFKRAGIG